MSWLRNTAMGGLLAIVGGCASQSGNVVADYNAMKAEILKDNRVTAAEAKGLDDAVKKLQAVKKENEDLGGAVDAVTADNAKVQAAINAAQKPKVRAGFALNRQYKPGQVKVKACLSNGTLYDFTFASEAKADEALGKAGSYGDLPVYKAGRYNKNARARAKVFNQFSIDRLANMVEHAEGNEGRNELGMVLDKAYAGSINDGKLDNGNDEAVDNVLYVSRVVEPVDASKVPGEPVKYTPPKEAPAVKAKAPAAPADN